MKFLATWLLVFCSFVSLLSAKHHEHDVNDESLEEAWHLNGKSANS